MTKATDYREAYITFSPTTVADYLTLVQTIDPTATMANRSGRVWIEFSDGSEWQLGAADSPAADMKHHDD